jgi:hypothetical protein
VSQCRSKLTQLGGRDAYAPARDMHERNLPREMERDGKRSDARDYANDRSGAAKHGRQSWSIARDSSLGQPLSQLRPLLSPLAIQSQAGFAIKTYVFGPVGTTAEHAPGLRQQSFSAEVVSIYCVLGHDVQIHPLSSISSPFQ